MLYILILASNVQPMTCSRRHLCSSYSANVSKVISPGTIYNLLELTWNLNKLTGGRMVSVVLCLNNNNNNNNNNYYYYYYYYYYYNYNYNNNNNSNNNDNNNIKNNNNN